MRKSSYQLSLLTLLICFLAAYSFQARAQEENDGIDIDQDVIINSDADDDGGRDLGDGVEADDDVPTLELGIRYMPTFTNFQVHDRGNGVVETEVMLGHGVGGVLGINFSEHVGIHGELMYSALAQRYRDNDLDHTIKLRYINIPVLLALHTGRLNVVNFNVVVGPQLGLNVGAEIEDGDNDTDINGDDADAVIAVKKGDLGLAYGAGLDFGLNEERTIRLGVGFRGVYGLIDISDDSGTRETDEYLILDKTHVKTYAAYLGLSFLF